MKLKKIISAALAFLMLSGCIMIGSASAADDEGLPFKDVGKKKWFYDAVKYVYDGELMNGTTADKFEPNANLSRAMFITILGRLAGAETKESDVFPDIKKNSWYSGYVGWAVDAGVVKGYDDGTFKPNKSLSRQEMAVAVDRFINHLGCRMTSRGGMWNFTDQDKVAKWAVDSLAVLRNSGVVEGDQSGNFNPKNNITRAEAATIIMKLQLAIANAWQGYLPEDGVTPVILGASYLYWTGAACSGGMAHELSRDGDYPVLEARMDRYTSANIQTYLHNNTVGVSINYMEIDITKTPYVKIAYAYNGMEGNLSAAYNVNVTKYETYENGFVENLTLTPGADDAGMKTALIDLTVINEAHPDINYSNQLANLIFMPCENSLEVGGTFDILYIGFFESRADAEAYTAAGNADIEDYLKNYEPYSTLNWLEYTDDVRAKYEKLLVDRIAEIKNSESAVTPEMIKAAGGECYYISSINGDDSNSGKSPDRSWKTFDNLFDIKAGGLVVLFIPKSGDAVFFERGSEWYAEKFYNYSMGCFDPTNSPDFITYGAYGEGPKPLFSGAIDFRSTGGTGNWVSTEWENVWRLDDESLNPDWSGTIEIGNMVFNDGEGIGVRIMPLTEEKCFGEGEVSTDRGFCCNGYEYFYTGVSDLTNPGTALKHNLEYIHDQEKGELYLYFDKGNPSDYFDDIKASRNAYVFFTGNNSRADNLHIAHSSFQGINPGRYNSTLTNCEIGFVGGSRSSVESGSEISGDTNGSYIYNCYIHDVGDGALTSQGSGGTAEKPLHIENIEYIGNVMVACGHSAEIWNGTDFRDENGHAIAKIRNVLVKDNIMAYTGYGFRQKQAGAATSGGETICSSISGEHINCRLENNIYLYGQGTIYKAYMATYKQPRGWTAKGNTYIANTYYYTIGYSYESINHVDHDMWKRVRIAFPYSYEGLVWYTSLGIDPMGTYYHFSDNSNEHEDNELFFMSGYYAERGGFELK